MTMRNGVKQVVDVTLDVKDEICTRMIDAGVDPKEALKASTVVTKDHIDSIIDKTLGNKSASGITKGLSDMGRNKSLSK